MLTQIIEIGSDENAACHRQEEQGVDDVNMRLELVIVPVSDVDRAKAFYQQLGWRLDADFSNGDDFRVV
jgi:hypothetical protein